MRIIKVIIFCVCTAVFFSAAAQAEDNRQKHISFTDNHSMPLIELSQNRNLEFKLQTPTLALPESGSVKHYPKLAAVHFLTNEKGIIFKTPSFEDKTSDNCKKAGYDLTTCADGTFPKTLCPYNGSYFKECCSADYKYTKTECTYPHTASANSCGGKYRCYCDRALYPIETASGCAFPKIPTSDTCTQDGTPYYSACICPSEYNKTCTEKNQTGVDTPCNHNGENKYTSCRCKQGYNLTCSGEGNSPADPTDYCLLNGIKYYNNCNTCANRCTVSELAKKSSIVYEYEECSKKYCAVGCALNYINWCVMPETDCAKLGYTKSVSQCPDGYLKCPGNSAAVFCPDENVSGSTGGDNDAKDEPVEDLTCKVASILYGDGTCSNGKIISGKTPIGIIFDSTNRLAFALSTINEDGSEGSANMIFSYPNMQTGKETYCNATDTSESNSFASCAPDGRANTDAILGQHKAWLLMMDNDSSCTGNCKKGCAAAVAANSYEPAGCTKDFCKKTKWFLPSLRDSRTIAYGGDFYTPYKLTSKYNSSWGIVWLWTSSERSADKVWMATFNGGAKTMDKRSSTASVRPVVKY